MAGANANPPAADDVEDSNAIVRTNDRQEPSVARESNLASELSFDADGGAKGAGGEVPKLEGIAFAKRDKRPGIRRQQGSMDIGADCNVSPRAKVPVAQSMIAPARDEGTRIGRKQGE